jgi:RHS repeat-associated protein
MAGDEISASTQYYFKTDLSNTGSSNITENIVSSLLAALTGGGATILPQKGNISSQLMQNGSFGSFVQPIEGNLGNSPRAYLSVLFFDERFNFIPEGSGQLRAATDADNSNANLSLLNLKAPKNGYAYIYVSNSSDVNVYFDNVKLAHTRGRIVEENHYYAFGLRIATISSKKLADQTGNEGNTTNSYLYNDKELFEDGDLGWYDYGFRQYDAQIGRFIEIDPLTDDYTLLSGYHYALNDPVSNIDVDGLSSINPMMQMLQCPGVVLQESIKIGLTQAISSLANGLSQNLQQKNTAQQAGKQGGGTDMKPSTQRSLDGVRGGPTAFEMNQRMEILAKMEWQRIVRKSWVHTYSNRWVNTVTGQVRYESQAIESVNWEVYVMPLPKFGFLGGVWGKLFSREAEVVAAQGGKNLVYQGFDKAGVVRYVGITERDAAVRFGEHLSSGTAKSLLRYEVVPGATNLSRIEAKVWEQTLINQYRLQKNGGLLLNKINSISPKSWWQYSIK